MPCDNTRSGAPWAPILCISKNYDLHSFYKLYIIAKRSYNRLITNLKQSTPYCSECGFRSPRVRGRKERQMTYICILVLLIFLAMLCLVVKAYIICGLLVTGIILMLAGFMSDRAIKKKRGKDIQKFSQKQVGTVDLGDLRVSTVIQDDKPTPSHQTSASSSSSSSYSYLYWLPRSCSGCVYRRGFPSDGQCRDFERVNHYQTY